MSQVIGTNVAALNAQRNLSSSSSLLTTSVQRLSSGLRINSAKDDAAGLAISSRMTTQVRGLQQASRNASDAVSMAQTAEGALEEVSNNLQRIRELSVQSSNATNSAGDRAALNAEVQQRLAEIDRIASTTAFNGTKLLDGSAGTSKFQVGANAGETIEFSLSKNLRSSSFGQVASNATSNTNAVGNAALTNGALRISIGSEKAVSIGASTSEASTLGTGYEADSAYAKAKAINAAGIGGLTTTASTSKTYSSFAGIDAAATSTYSLSINGTSVISGGAAGTDYSASEVTAAINAKTGQTGVTAVLDESNNLTLSTTDGRSISFSEVVGTAALTTASAFTSASATGTNVTTERGKLSMSAAEEIKVTGDGATLLNLSATTISTDGKSFAQANVSSVANANDMMTRIDAALTTVNNMRAGLGALQNRFESTIANLNTRIESTQAARSRIIDADFATETSNLTRAQILQQAGTAMLAQANQVPQSVLKLLG